MQLQLLIFDFKLQLRRRCVFSHVLLSSATHTSLVSGRPQFCRSRASRVEQSSSRSLSAEHFTASVQETTENVPVLG